MEANNIECEEKANMHESVIKNTCVSVDYAETPVKSVVSSRGCCGEAPAGVTF